MFEITFPVDVSFSLSFSHPIFPPHKIVAKERGRKEKKTIRVDYSVSIEAVVIAKFERLRKVYRKVKYKDNLIGADEKPLTNFPIDA